MKFSYSSLDAFLSVDTIKKRFHPKEFAHYYSIHTAEIESVTSKADIAGCKVAKVLSTSNHPDSDHLHLVQVTLGEEPIQIVCGASNVVGAQFVVLATIGTTLAPDFVIARSKIRGQYSNGMICSEDELGLQSERSGGILRLETLLSGDILETFIGCDFRDLPIDFGLSTPSGSKTISLADTIFEIDNKNITHRPDLFSIEGHAREIAALLEIPFSPYAPNWNFPEKPLSFSIESEKVFAFHLLEVRNIQSLPSNKLLQFRLESLDLSVVSGLVDITNAVMIELGQPMHAFDADKVVGNICVRNAKKGESLEALDGKTYQLHENDLVIADDVRVLSLAGVIGGSYSAISDSTQHVYFESACFDPTSIRLTAQRHGIRTDASTRFEKSQDPLNCPRGLYRTKDYLEQLGLNSEFSAYGSWISPKVSSLQSTIISTTPHFLSERLGISITCDEIQKILSPLGFDVRIQGEAVEITVPSFRATKDITLPEDIGEEIARFKGFDLIEPRPIPGNFAINRKNHRKILLYKLLDICAAQGGYEVYNYSFTNEEKESLAKIDSSFLSPLSVKNAFSNEFQIMRRSLFPYLLQSLAKNQNKGVSLHFFEYGKVFSDTHGVATEKPYFAGLKTESSLSSIRSLLDCIVADTLPDCSLEVVNHAGHPTFHPNVSGKYMLGEATLIRFGLLHPAVASAYNLPDTTWGYEIDLDLLYSRTNSNFSYQEISKYPSIIRELNFLVPRSISAFQVEKMISLVSPLIESVTTKEIYESENFGQDIRSISFRILLVPQDETFTLESAGLLQDAIIQTLAASNIPLRTI